MKKRGVLDLKLDSKLSFKPYGATFFLSAGKIKNLDGKINGMLTALRNAYFI